MNAHDQQQYITGFNEGYRLAEHLPDVARLLGDTEGDSPRMLGIRDGRQQYIEEWALKHMYGHLSRRRRGQRRRKRPGFRESHDHDEDVEHE